MSKPIKIERSKGRSIQNLYDLNDRLYALEVLRENNFDYNKASVEVGIPPDTIEIWAKKLLPTMSEVNIMGRDGATEIAKVGDNELEESYSRTVKEIRHLMLERMKDLVIKEKDLDKTTRALKTLHEIATGNTPWGRETPVSANRFYNQVNNVILQISNKNES